MVFESFTKANKYHVSTLGTSGILIKKASNLTYRPNKELDLAWAIIPFGLS